MERESQGIVRKAQPYLRSGRGTESRQQASQSSKKYIPKGGFVIDFTTQPLPKGRGRAVPNGCDADVPREVLIARQQRAAARLSAPRNSAGNSPVTKKLELTDLDFPDHPKPWGAARCKAALKRNVGPHLATLGSAKQLGHQEKVATQAGPRCLTAKTKVSRAGLSAAAQPSSETLDENDIFDDDAPLLSDIQISTTPDAARASVLTDSFQAGASHQARYAPGTSLYVQQLLSREAPAHEGGVQKELLHLKEQITQAAAVLELEKQAFQRSRAEDETAWREVTKREERRLQREKAILSRQSQVLLKLPSKREKAEVEALLTALEEERRLGRAKDARHKLTVQRLQRHVTQLQGKVAELEDEVRWHAKHAANAAQLPTRTGQLHSSSPGVSLKPQLQAPLQNYKAAKSGALQQHVAEDGSDCQENAQLPSSRPATPEHPEQQLCSGEPPRKQSRTGATAAPGLQQAMVPFNNTAADDSSVKAAGKEAEGTEDQPGNVPDIRTAIREAAEHGRHHSDRRKPSAVSWQIEAVRSRKPAPAHVVLAKSQGDAGACSASPMQLSTGDNGTSPSRKGHEVLPDAKSDSTTLVKSGPSPASHLKVQSAMRPSQRPKARPLPPLPDFMSLEAFRSPSYSQDMPRMEALYAATDGVSAFPDKPITQTDANKLHHSSPEKQDAGTSGIDTPTPSSGAACQGTSGIQPGSSVGSAYREGKHEANISRQRGSAIQPDQAHVSSDSLQQTFGPSLCAALHVGGATATPDTAANGMSTQQQCSTKLPQDESMSKPSVFERPVSPKMEALNLAASSTCVSADAIGASSGVSDTRTAKHDLDVQLNGCASASADEYSSIKASLRTLQELLNNPQNPTAISKPRGDAKAGSSLVTSGVSKYYRHASQSTSGAKAQSIEQPKSQHDAHALLTVSDAPEHSQAACEPASFPSLQQAQRHGFHTGDTHEECAGLPDRAQDSGPGFGNSLCRDHSQQDIRLGGTHSRAVVRFRNRDCKCSYADGTVEYYYAKADTWHTTCPGGIEVYHFPSGQTEAHHPGGLKEIIFQDGSVRLVDREGAESAAELELLSKAVRRSRPDWEEVHDTSMQRRLDNSDIACLDDVDSHD